jgi:undecaprenyl-diphosphatase
MIIWLALLLGVIQGLTEFLPVSSSGHLRLMAAAFGVTDPQTLFDVCVHAGTLGAVLAVYRKDVLRMLGGLFRPSWSEPGFRLGILVVVGTIPAAVIGIGLGHFFESTFASVTAVGGFLLINGCILMLSRNAPEGGRTLDELTLRDAILIGCAQSFALFRGISRSGTTIVAALKIGVEREAAASFSFLLSIPAIGGAVLLEGRKAFADGGVDVVPLAVGAVSAGLSGYIALRFLITLVRGGKLHHFAWYCWALGILALALGQFG